MSVRLLGFVALLSRCAIGAVPPTLDDPLPVSFDVDRDGVQDVIRPSMQYHEMIPLAGQVRVYRGMDEHLYFEAWSRHNNDLFGYAATSAGDLDGDGHAEVLVGAPWATMRDWPDMHVGRVDILAGATGAQVASIDGEATMRVFGRAVAGLGDVNGDGVGDLAVSHRLVERPAEGGRQSAEGGFVDAVSMYDGRTGLLISRIVNDEVGRDGFGTVLGGVGDISGDGRADVLIGDGVGSVWCVAGDPLRVTRRATDAAWHVDLTASHPGEPGRGGEMVHQQIAPASDLNGDGRRDVLVINAWFEPPARWSHEVSVLDSRDGATLRTFTMPGLRAPADVNFDHVVDDVDLAIVHAHLGTVPELRHPMRADVDGDGVVGLLDCDRVMADLGLRSPLDGIVVQPLVDPQDDPGVDPLPPGFDVDPLDPCALPWHDCDHDGIPNVNDPDSPFYDPHHPCSWILEDCDGDDVPNWLDEDWWFYFFREPDPNACADALKHGYDFPGDVPWDHIPGENNPLHPCYDKRHPLSDPDRDGQPNAGDHDDDGDGIPDEIDDDPYCPCDTGACGPCDYPAPPPGDDAPPPFDDDGDGSGGGGGGGGGEACDVDILLRHSFAPVPDYLDVRTDELALLAHGGDPDFGWSWTIDGPASLEVDADDPRYASVVPLGLGTITITAERGCEAVWHIHTLESNLALMATTITHPDDGSQVYLLPVNADDDDADDRFDWDITDVSNEHEDDGRDAALAPVDGDPLAFDASAWTLWHDGSVRVWYPVDNGDLRTFAWNGPWDDPLDRTINGVLHRVLPRGEYIRGLPVNERRLVVEALLPTYAYGDAHLGYTIWSQYLQDHDDDPRTDDVLRAVTINRPVSASLMRVDVDLDSDNNQGFDPPDRSAAEEWREAFVGDPLLPGKTILANTGDIDRDGVTDFADGYDRLPDPFVQDDFTNGNRFVPVEIEAAGIRLADTSLLIEYDASDPMGVVTDGEDLYRHPPGAMRLWRENGYVARDARPLDEGGDFVPPGIHALTDLMDGTGSMTVRLYIEVVRESVVTGDLPISITLHTGSTSWPEFSDAAHVNGVRVELRAMNFNGTTWRHAEGVIGTTIGTEPNDGELSESAWQIYTLALHDPRGSTLTEITMNGQIMPMYYNGTALVTPPFVCDGAIAGPPPVPDVVVLDHDGALDLSYNPTWTLPSVASVTGPPKYEKKLAELLKTIPEDMETEGWVPENPDDSGAYGKEVHRRISAELGDDVRWATDVFVDAETNEILSVGHVPPGGRRGTTEIDILRLQRGYRLEIGEVLDPQRVDDLYEIKTSVSGSISDDQLARLKRTINGGEVTLGLTEKRWIPDTGWQDVRRVRNIFRILGIAGMATVAYAYLVPDSTMPLYEQIGEEYDDLEFARNQPSPDDLEITLEAADVVAATRAYLVIHVEDPAIVDLITQLAIYKAMDEEK